MGELVRLEVEEGVATMRLDRPKMNVLNVALQEEIREVASEVAARADVRAVVVYGGERVFAAGADIQEMVEMSAADMEKRSGPLQSSLTAVARIPKPVVAAINGPAVGVGLTMTLPMDVRLAVTGAKLAVPFVRRGIATDGCASWFLPRVVGVSTALSPARGGSQQWRRTATDPTATPAPTAPRTPRTRAPRSSTRRPPA